MNHIYKVVFNRALGAWVAVSELTKSYKKRASATAVAVALVAGLLSPFAQASETASRGENERENVGPDKLAADYYFRVTTTNTGEKEDLEHYRGCPDGNVEAACPNTEMNVGVLLTKQGKEANSVTEDSLTDDNSDESRLVLEGNKGIRLTKPRDEHTAHKITFDAPVEAAEGSNAISIKQPVEGDKAGHTIIKSEIISGTPDKIGVESKDGVTKITWVGGDTAGGAAGEKGADGKSAYEIWKDANPDNATKSEADFLASLKGAKGDKGADGAKGDTGKSAYEIWKDANPDNATKSEADFLASLKGAKGDKGADGAKGDTGKSAYEIWKDANPDNVTKSEADFLASLKGAKGEAGAVDTDGTTINVTGGKVSAVTGAIENNAGNAKAKNGDGAKLTTVANVADAINAAKTVVTNADNTTNVNLDADGKTYKVAARVADDKGLEKTDSGLVVKAGNGVEVGSDGVGVKTKKNGGIIVDKDGLSVDLPFTRTEEPDGTMVTFKGKPAADRPNGEVRIGGVAAGMVTPTSTDAVNGSQLYAVGSRVDRLQDKVDKLGKRADAGVAGALATANLLQPHHPGQSVATAAVGNHNGQTAIAVGYATMSDNGKYGMRFSFGANSQRDVSLGAGLGYFW